MKNKKILIIILLIVAIIIGCCTKFLKKDNNITINNENLVKDETDKSVVVIEENTEGSIKDSVIDKNGDSSDLAESDKNGLNSAVLVNQLSIIDIDNSKITTNGTGSSGVSAVGANAIANISNSEIITTNNRSKGLLVTGNGQAYAKDLNISTSGYKSSAIATDRGGGRINVSNSDIKTAGTDSVGVYSTGEIILNDCSISTSGAEGAVIDGTGKIEFTNVTINASKKRGVMIFYTGPRVGGNVIGTFRMRDGILNVQDGPAFYVTNTTAEIYLNNVQISTQSGIFLDASVDKYGELGQEGGYVESNGGNAKVYLTEQTISGDITVDNQSTVELNLENNSNFKGAINAENTGKKINVTLDSTSVWNLTANSYITTLDAADGAQINTNGYTINYIETVEEAEKITDSPYGPGRR